MGRARYIRHTRPQEMQCYIAIPAAYDVYIPSHGQPVPIRQRSNTKPFRDCAKLLLSSLAASHAASPPLFLPPNLSPPPPPLPPPYFSAFRSADGAFNAALLLERGDPFSAIASAAGLPIPSTRHHASSSSSSAPQLPLRPTTLPLGQRERSATTASPPTVAGGGSSSHVGGHSNGADSSRHRNFQHYQRRQRDDIGVDEDDHGPGATQSAADFHRRGKDVERQTDAASEGRLPGAAGARRKKPQAQGDSRNLWGDRPRALRMFERAAELGHTGATPEVHRLRLRERMDHLVGHGREYKAP